MCYSYEQTEQTMVHALTSIAIAEQTETMYIYERTNVPVFSHRTWTLFQQPRFMTIIPFNTFTTQQIH